MSRDGDADLKGFAIHPAAPAEPVLGRLVDRGLQDEMRGTAYAVIASVDGRTHHVSFDDLRLTATPRLARLSKPAATATAKAARRWRWRSAATCPSPIRSRRRGRLGWTASSSENPNRPHLPALAPKSVTRSSPAPIIWPQKAWPNERISAWSSPAICWQPCATAS